MNDKIVLVLSTVPDMETAQSLATILVEEGHAACVNIIPAITSIYRWQGKVTRDSESLLLIKTAAVAYANLEQRLTALHPYELPEIITVPVDNGLATYLDWVTTNTGLIS